MDLLRADIESASSTACFASAWGSSRFPAHIRLKRATGNKAFPHPSPAHRRGQQNNCSFCSRLKALVLQRFFCRWPSSRWRADLGDPAVLRQQRLFNGESRVNFLLGAFTASSSGQNDST
jgi:hypothetical protein